MKIIINGFSCENVKELKEHFNIVEVLKEFLNLNLEDWLKQIEALEFFKVSKIDKSAQLERIADQICQIFNIALSQKDEAQLKEFINKTQLQNVKSLEIRLLNEIIDYFNGDIYNITSINEIENLTQTNKLAVHIFGKSHEVRQNISNYIDCMEVFKNADEFLKLQLKHIKEASLYEYALKLNDYKDIKELEDLVKKLNEDEKNSFKQDEFKQEDFYKQDSSFETQDSIAQTILKTFAFGSAALVACAASEVLFDEKIIDIDEILDEANESFNEFLNSLSF